jgi:hypothetical protein
MPGEYRRRRALATTTRMAPSQTGAVSWKSTHSPECQFTSDVDQIVRPSGQARAFHWNFVPAADHSPDPWYRWPVDRDGRGARWSRLDSIALRSRGEPAIGSWVEREPCGMTETGTCDRLVTALGYDEQSISTRNCSGR